MANNAVGTTSAQPKPDSESSDKGAGRAAAGAHLKRRQKRNTDLTEESMRNPTGGAHSGTPDHNNP